VPSPPSPPPPAPGEPRPRFVLSEDLPLTIFVGVATAVVFSLLDLGPEWTLLGVATAPLVADVIKHYVVARGWGKRRLAFLTVVLVFFGRVKEALARPVRRLRPPRPGPSGNQLARPRWYSVAATAAVASAVTIAFFSMVEAASGEALLADRRWTVWPDDGARPARLEVRKEGSGTVTTTPDGIDCGDSCSASYRRGSTVDLPATAAPRSAFAGWDGGGCSGTSACQVSMHGDVEVTARFRPVGRTVPLTIRQRGNGIGTVTSDPTGIRCGDVCRGSYQVGARVVLVAQAAPGSIFAGWRGGGCFGVGSCAVAMAGPKIVVASFRRATGKTVKLTLDLQGEGRGGVVSTPSGIDCEPTCSSEFEVGTQVTLTAQAEDGSTFDGWSGGGCTGQEPCLVTLDEDTSVAAAFKRAATAEVAVRISGAGSVSSNPSGISCGVSCSASFEVGSTVTLTASAGDGYTFAGWRGADCSGTGVCVVNVDGPKLVYAVFRSVPTTFTLTVSIVEDGGSGIVRSIPGGIGCPSSCSTSFRARQRVRLIARADSESDFYGFSGDCSGFSCTLTMDRNRSVSVLFRTRVD
jgi:Divergent InlB B-repeat domain